MKILKLEAENFKKLKAIEITPVNNIIEITGLCEQGKTSILDVIKATLCGEKFAEPIRQGEKTGKSVVDLGDKIVTRTFTESGGSLKVESKDGAKYPSPQALLDSLVGKIAFDPLAFAREKDSKKQVDMLLKVVEIKVDTEHLKDISGVVVPVMPNPLDMLNTAYKSVYEERTLSNRQLDSAKKILESIPAVEKVEEVLLTDLVTERDGLERTIRENKDKRDDVESQRKYAQEKEKFRDSIAVEIEGLEKQLNAKREALKAATNVVIESEKELKMLEDVAVALKDPDLTDINTRIANADATNKQAKQYADRLVKQDEVTRLQSDVDSQNKKLEDVRKYKTEIISKTKFPVPGLDFENGGVTFNGKPFSQASSAEKMRVSLGIVLAGSPQLKVALLDGYESLDKHQRQIIEQMAANHDFQIWCTSVSDDETVGIYIEDGEIKK